MGRGSSQNPEPGLPKSLELQPSSVMTSPDHRCWAWGQAWVTYRQPLGTLEGCEPCPLSAVSHAAVPLLPWDNPRSGLGEHLETESMSPGLGCSFRLASPLVILLSASGLCLLLHSGSRVPASSWGLTDQPELFDS